MRSGDGESCSSSSISNTDDDDDDDEDDAENNSQETSISDELTQVSAIFFNSHQSLSANRNTLAVLKSSRKSSDFYGLEQSLLILLQDR